MRGRPRQFRHIWVLATLLLGAVATVFAVVQREHANAAFVKERFETESRELADAIVARFSVYEYGLRSARGLMQHAGEYGLTASDFNRYMRSRDLEREFPGARGFGFIHRVPANRLLEHAGEHLGAVPSAASVHGMQAHEGEHFVIELIEPIESNREALGLDIASEPMRRQAAMAALRSGRATMTAPITLVQARQARSRSFVVLLPLYRPGMLLDGPAQREAAGYGWAFAPLVTDEVLAGLPLGTQHIALTLTDITETEHAAEFFNTSAQGPAPAAGALSTALLRVPYGRSWMVRTEARPTYAAQFALLPPRVVGWTGALVTLLLAALQWVWLAMRQRHRQAAEQQAQARAVHEQHLLELNAGLEQRVQERTQSLAEVEHFLRTVLDAVPSMISYWDRHQINRTANRANLAWRLPKGGTLVGRSVREVVGETVYAEMRPRIEAVLRGEPQSFEVVIHSPADGEPRELHVRYLPDLRDGEVKGYYAVLDDVTEVNRSRRDLEAALAVQATEHRRLQSIVEGTHVGTWEWNVQTGECRYNERWAEIVGHDYDELRPDNVRFWVEFIHPDDLVHARQLLERHFSGELAFYECETRMRHLDGHWVWVLNRGQVRSWTADGQPEWMYGTELDISKQKAIEHDLREATRAAEAASQSKSAFLANMSHEIRTPLNAVLGVAHLLADSPLSDDQRALLGKAQAAGRSLLGIINDVLDLAKIEAGEMRLTDEPFALCDLLREVASVYAVQASDKGLTLNLRVDPAVPPAVRGDMARLRQVLVNLVGNALKFTHTGGVHIAASVHGDAAAPRLRLSVRDSGIGIATDLQARLFQPFTQADETTTRRFGGTGLGLSIVHRLVDLMAGQVGLDSAPGQGSDFWLSIPLRRADLASLPTPVAPASAAARGLSGLRVLLVDDSEVNLEIAQRMLERQGARVHTCGDGAQALGWLHRSPGAVDVVLMDVQMPVMDGLEATRRLRADTTFAGLPVIALTAGALANERQRAHDAGFSDFLAKPLDPQELVATLRRACPRPLRDTDTDTADAAPDTLPADWPRVQGVDAASAHRQLGGDAVLFHRVFARLLAERADWAALAPDGPRQWAIDQTTAWRARAHRLRGSAGMVGAQALARAATDLETALDAHATDDAVQAAVALRQAFADLNAAAAGLAEAAAPAPLAAPPLDDAHWHAEVQALAAQLEANDLAASERFDTLRPALSQRLGAALAQAMAEAIDNLDFGAARERLCAAMDEAEGETAP